VSEPVPRSPTTNQVNDFSWMVGGPQGSGVDSAANVFARGCAAGGLHIFGKREFYSNIMGEHSYFALRAHSNLVRSHIDAVNLLATFEAETLFRHAREVTDDGAIIYDPLLTKTRLSDVPTIEKRLDAELKTYLISHGVGETLDDMLAATKQRGVTLVPIPFRDLLEQVADEFHIDQLSKILRVVNMLAVGASFGLLNYDFAMMRTALEDVFRAKAKVVEMNAAGAQKAYDIARSLVPDFRYRLEKIPRREPRMFLTGSQATALGKLYGGMRFQTYYPITPASDESEFLEENEILDVDGHGLLDTAPGGGQEKGGSILVVQTEDEIAAVTMATGAALTGARSATATSGPGFSLMMEGIGWASINEVPLVITLYQRAGPSTGMPTRHEQGDLRFALHAGHGESPRIVLASGDFEECIQDGFLAFNYAERYQMPVIHLVDKALANSYATIPPPDLSELRIERGAVVDGNNGYSQDNPYKRFDLGNGPISPRAILGQEGTIFWNTGDEHDERGHITEDPVLRNAMMEKRFKKLDLAAREIPEDAKVRYFGPKDATTMIVSWGSTKGPLLDALDRLWAEGAKIGYLHVRLINPFPLEEVRAVLAKARRRIGIEMNFGAQLAGVVREHTGIAMTHLILKYNGRPMSNTELYDAIRTVVKGKADKRTVLTRGS
jgi:2-oxoglutarate/2-oxoacid ferredoxin oxidoreductase subunit alpha